MKKFLVSCLLVCGTCAAFAQNYSPRVSKDSLAVLTTRVEILKMNNKVLALKIKEAEEEAEVEKLRIKLVEAEGDANASADKSSSTSKNSNDLKVVEKTAKKARNDGQNAQKALERLAKQIANVEDIRDQIQREERKLGYRKPNILFVSN
ncbi:hypothetical protein [Pedobacter sandarakinus]|uniref:hypothetical protein n=1 Tax=Pedobacter sandarakinus TaxID=353156 RepID=UPI002245D378|nr:hypothetical protein [Pedobacter sandarakinus]MCX2573190.1 hypothetical protein [Pedobacter sandarakinus]